MRCTSTVIRSIAERCGRQCHRDTYGQYLAERMRKLCSFAQRSRAATHLETCDLDRKGPASQSLSQQNSFMICTAKKGSGFSKSLVFEESWVSAAWRIVDLFRHPRNPLGATAKFPEAIRSMPLKHQKSQKWRTRVHGVYADFRHFFEFSDLGRLGCLCYGDFATTTGGNLNFTV
jgi:hypothetical protein